MTLRILHVSPYFAPAYTYGGPPRSILGLTKALLAQNLHVRVLTTTANGQAEFPAREGEYQGVPVRYCQLVPPRRYFASRELEQWLGSHLAEYDLIHLHGCWNLPVWAAARACIAQGSPFVISPKGMLIRGLTLPSRIKKFFGYHLRERRHLARACALHATTDAEYRHLRSLVPRAPIVVLPYGVDAPAPADGDLFRERLGISRDAPVILYLGRIHPIKRIGLLGEAMAQVIRKCPEARLVVVGTGEQRYQDSLTARFRDLIESGHMIFAGHLEARERDEAYAAADLFALTSASESFGMSILEALAAGLPVVLSEECPWPEVVAWGVGRRVSAVPETIAGALVELLSSRELLARMAEAAARKIQEQFSWSVIGERMARTYAALLEAPPLPHLPWIRR